MQQHERCHRLHDGTHVDKKAQLTTHTTTKTITNAKHNKKNHQCKTQQKQSPTQNTTKTTPRLSFPLMRYGYRGLRVKQSGTKQRAPEYIIQKTPTAHTTLTATTMTSMPTPKDAGCNRGSSFRLKWFLNDGPPQPKIVGKIAHFFFLQ